MIRFPEIRRLSVLALAVILAACSADESTGNGVPRVSLIPSPATQGSFAPNISSGSDGPLVLSWLEPHGEDGHALRYSVLGESGWSPVSTVAAGERWFANWADFPSVVPVSDSLWGAHWLVRREAGGYAYDIHAAVSTDAGQTWSDPFVPHTDNTDTEHGFVSMYPDGKRIGMVWLDGRKFVNEVTEDVAASGMTLRSAAFGADLVARNEVLVDKLICDCCQTDVTVTPEGPVAVYRNRTANEIRDIYATRLVDGEWQEGNAVSEDNWDIPGCPVNGPVVQSNGSQVAVAWFSAANERSKIQVAWSDDSAKTFAPAIEVAADNPLGHVGSALLDNGDLIVSWQRRTGAGGTELCLRRVSPDGEMGEIRVLREATGIFAISVPQIARIDDDLVLAWTVEDDDSYSIRTAMVPVGYLD